MLVAGNTDEIYCGSLHLLQYLTNYLVLLTPVSKVPVFSAIRDVQLTIS